jgi:hypothetical protein
MSGKVSKDGFTDNSVFVELPPSIKPADVALQRKFVAGRSTAIENLSPPAPAAASTENGKTFGIGIFKVRIVKKP